MRNVIRCCSLLFALALFLPLTAVAQNATVTADRVNVRATAAIDGSIVGQLSRGTTVTVVEKTDTWTKIQSGSMTGWVRSNLLSAATSSGSPATATKTETKASDTKASGQPSVRAPSTSTKSSSQDATPGMMFDGTNKFLGVHVGASGVGGTAAFGANLEFPYSERIGIGAWVDYWNYGDSFSGGSTDYTYIALAGTGAYHFPIASNPKLDPFVGLAVGYFIVSYDCKVAGFDCDDFNGDFDASRLFVGGFGGVRYGFTNSIAGVARLGFGASYLTLGVDWKM